MVDFIEDTQKSLGSSTNTQGAKRELKRRSDFFEESEECGVVNVVEREKKLTRRM